MSIQTDPDQAEVTFDATDTAAINAAVDDALNTAIPGTNTANSINDVLLDQLSPRLPGSGTIATTANLEAATAIGKLQMATTTESLNQAAATYDLLTGTTQAVVLEKLNVKMATGNVGGALTSISIQTDDATTGVIISSTNGAVANLLSEADISWTGALLINVGTKIQLTIAGGAHGSAYVATVVAQSRAVVAGGYLAVSA